MPVILTTSQKGGSGKTTVTRNLSVAAARDGGSVLLIDMDPQGSLRAWWQARQADGPSMLETDPAPDQLIATMNKARKSFDWVFVDTPPAAIGWLRAALGAADALLLPCRPSPDDLRAIGPTLTAAQKAGVPFAFVLTQAPRARITDEAARVLASHGRLAPINLSQRVAYAESGADGLSVLEGSDSKAASEINELWNYVKGLPNGENSQS